MSLNSAPDFWWQPPGWKARCLGPISAAYGAIAGSRMERGPRQPVDAPVICIGNYTVGGAGKTPTALALARAARAMGLSPGFLSRGYGGSIKRPTEVDLTRHSATDVGDEPLLLAREARTVVARRRLEGARHLVELGTDLIIMDDGFQSAQLHVDYALIVVDGRRGLGNARVVPAGPLRAPLLGQLHQTSAILRVGSGAAAEPLVRAGARAGKALFLARLSPQSADDLKGVRVAAFAGIGDPEKFFATLRNCGADIVESRSFGDHRHLSEDEAKDLLSVAAIKDLQLVTTSKDAVRLQGRKGVFETLLRQARVVEVEMAFEDPGAPAHIIRQARTFYARRRGGSI